MPGHARSSVSLDDSFLVTEALGGDRQAFAILVERHRPLLFALCTRMLRDVELAQEAAQEATLQALLALDRLRKPGRFGQWLAGIGLNVCRRWLEERRRAPSSWESVQGGRLFAGLTDERGPEEIAEQRELAARVRGAVSALPERQRTAVALFYLSGMTYAETAEALGTEVGAIKSRLHKARQVLKRELREFWKEENMAAKKEAEAIPVRIAEVRRMPVGDDATRQHVLVLDEIDGDRQMRIWVGQAEGTAIALLFENVQVPRPLTFTFMADLVHASGAKLRSVRIVRLTNDTFFATAVVEHARKTVSVDARPSDAIALGMALGAPITVDPEVFEACREREEAHPSSQEERERWNQAPRSAEIVAEATSKWPRFSSRPAGDSEIRPSTNRP